MATQFEIDQKNDKWRAWLADMDAEIDVLLREVPGMPENPWSLEGLRHVEQFILRRFPSLDDVSKNPENWPLADRLARFIGEVFHRLFEGKWENHPEEYTTIERYPDFGPAITNEWTDVPLDVGNDITIIIHRQRGEHLSLIYRHRVEDYAKWVESGRPPRIEYLLT
ncbi:hypothetical protein [Nocardia jiangxiensis]|uniref:hypothetical protein n=1 Tax=Nocardia jiangxiensis TaxID=282685 RepID=UPI0002DD849D|nr:hypothetical protein [Nocardia jiangxiensis]